VRRDGANAIFAVSMNKIGLIIWREFLTRVRKPSFLIMTLLGPLLIGGGVTAVMYLGLQEASDHLVLVIDKSGLFTGKLKDGEHVKFHYDHADWSDSAFKASPYTMMIDVNEDVLNTNRVLLFYATIRARTCRTSSPRNWSACSSWRRCRTGRSIQRCSAM
jgi:hypothetical protein